MACKAFVLRTFLAAATALAFVQPVAAGSYKVDPAHSNVGFSVRHLVGRVTGSFQEFSGSISYDADSPEKSTVSATIKAGSISTGNDRRDNHLRSGDFFDVEKYAEISFNSTSARQEGDRLMVTGDLTMHGVTRSVTMPIEVLGTGVHPMAKVPVAGFSAELKLNRSDYGVNSWTDPAGIVGDEVKITINIEAMGAKSANPCNPCGGKNACNPCGAKNACNPCGAKNPCNPCGE
jgi:polyisoprenoid-binding protein YceI